MACKKDKDRIEYLNIHDVTVTNIKQHSATISAAYHYKDEIPNSFVVKYGTDKHELYTDTIISGERVKLEVSLDNLQPNTTYFYELEIGYTMDNGREGILSGIKDFTTAK